MLEKLKSLLLNDHLFFGLIVVLVGVSSFALGRASVVSIGELGLSHTSVSRITASESEFTANKPTETNQTATSSNNILLVASKSGTKYHLENCSGGKQIKEANKIFFTSRQAAEAAGYKPAANCPGLQ